MHNEINIIKSFYWEDFFFGIPDESFVFWISGRSAEQRDLMSILTKQFRQASSHKSGSAGD